MSLVPDGNHPDTPEHKEREPHIYADKTTTLEYPQTLANHFNMHNNYNFTRL